MEAILTFFQRISDLGATAILPVVIFLLGLIFRVKPGVALKSGIRVGVGIFGITLMITVLVEKLTPVATILAEKVGAAPMIDTGVGAEVLIAFAFPFLALMIPLGILLNIFLLLIRFTKTVNVDVWNFWAWALSAQLVYTVTGSFVWAWVAFFATGIVSIKLGDIQAPKMQEVYGLEGISFPHPFSTVYAILAPPFNKLFNLIGLDKIKASPENIQKKLGAWGDTTVIAAVIGFVVGLIAGVGVGESLGLGIAFAAVVLLFPRVISYLVEGIIPISDAARDMLRKRYEGRDFYIGLDCAIGVGQPANIVCNVLMIPIMFILSLVLPGVSMIPVGVIAGVHAGFMLSGAMPYFENNIFKGLVYATIMYIVAVYAGTAVAPIITEAYVAAGGVIEEGVTQVSTAVPYMWSTMAALIAKLFS